MCAPSPPKEVAQSESGRESQQITGYRRSNKFASNFSKNEGNDLIATSLGAQHRPVEVAEVGFGLSELKKLKF